MARVIEIFARRFPEDRVLFSTLCKHLHRHLGFFEPVDFVRFTRGLALAEYRGRPNKSPYTLAPKATVGPAREVTRVFA